VLQVQFKSSFPTPLDAAYLTFLGPLLGSLIRPVGGMLADRFGVARVTALNFIAMAGGAALVLAASMQKSLPLFVVAFTLLFVLSGLGNGSTYKMIPAIFRAKSQLLIDAGTDLTSSDREARRLSGALIGIAGAMAPSAASWSTSPFGSPSCRHTRVTRRTSRSSATTPSVSP